MKIPETMNEFWHLHDLLESVLDKRGFYGVDYESALDLKLELGTILAVSEGYHESSVDDLLEQDDMCNLEVGYIMADLEHKYGLSRTVSAIRIKRGREDFTSLVNLWHKKGKIFLPSYGEPKVHDALLDYAREHNFEDFLSEFDVLGRAHELGRLGDERHQMILPVNSWGLALVARVCYGMSEEKNALADGYVGPVHQTEFKF